MELNNSSNFIESDEAYARLLQEQLFEEEQNFNQQMKVLYI